MTSVSPFCYNRIMSQSLTITLIVPEEPKPSYPPKVEIEHSTTEPNYFHIKSIVREVPLSVMTHHASFAFCKIPFTITLNDDLSFPDLNALYFAMNKSSDGSFRFITPNFDFPLVADDMKQESAHLWCSAKVSFERELDLSTSHTIYPEKGNEISEKLPTRLREKDPLNGYLILIANATNWQLIQRGTYRQVFYFA